MKGQMPIPRLIHSGQGCGFPGGCNNTSPAIPELAQIKIDRLPARLIVLLWKRAPRAASGPCDITFTINYGQVR